MSNKDDLRYAEASLRVLREPYVGHGKLEVLPKVMARDLRALVAERQAFVAARTPKY